MEEDDMTLVIDLDDEKEETQDGQNNTGEVTSPIINDKHNTNQNNLLEASSEILKATLLRNSQDSVHNSDDDILVIDDDDDWEVSDLELINAANKIGTNARQEYSTSSVNGANVHQIRNRYKNNLRRNQDDTGLRRSRVIRYVENKRFPEANNELSSGYQYMTDHMPRLVNESIPLRTDTYIPNDLRPYRLGAVPPYMGNDTIRREVPLAMDGYYSTTDMYGHVLRPEICVRDNYFSQAPINETYIHQVQRASLRRETIDTDEYSRTGIDRLAHFHRLDRTRFDDYRYGAIERDHYRYAYRQNELLRNNDHRQAIRNRLSYGHYIPDSNIDDYWQTMMNRDVYRPEGVSIQDYERTIRESQVYRNIYDPLVDLRDPYIELPSIYRPHLVNMEAYRDEMFIRNAYNRESKDMLYHEPLINPNINEIDYAYNGTTLDLSRKQEILNVKDIRLRDKSIYDDKQQNILSSGKQLSVHKSEEIPIDVRKPEHRISRPNTVILSTENVYSKKKSAEFDVMTASKSTYGRCGNTPTSTARETENLKAPVGKPVKKQNYETNQTHDGKVVDHEKEFLKNNGVKIDNNIRFLVVFFSRVRELVEGTFPEFSKSLEKEIENLGEWTNSGKMKTDIQFICPIYCSVSTYYLPRFDNSDDDSKIEKHVNRNKICDVCSCIQNCYKLYKKKYLKLISTTTDDQHMSGPEILQESTNVNSPTDNASTRTHGTQTVICSPKNMDCHKIVKNPSNITNINEKLRMDPIRSNINITTVGKLAQNTNNEKVIKEHDSETLNEKRLLDSLSVLNLNLPNINTKTKTASSNPTDSLHNNSRMETGEVDKSTVINGTKVITNKIKHKNNVFRGAGKARPYSDKIKAELAMKIRDKIGQTAETIFTCHICSCAFTHFTSFERHMQKEHNENKISMDSNKCVALRCPFCGICSKLENHNDHVKTEHAELFTYKESTDKQIIKEHKNRKSMKRKFIFTCLVCHKNLNSAEVKRHREEEHKGLTVAKMFTKKLSSMD